MTVRIAIANDGMAIALLHGENFEAAWDEETIQGFIASDLVLVSTRHDALMGFIIVRHLFDEAEILSLCVQKAARQNGLGSALVSAACDLIVKLGVQKLFLEVAEDNNNALTLYRRAGFSQIGTRKGYYVRRAGPPIDAIIMSISLDATKTTHTS